MFVSFVRLLSSLYEHQDIDICGNKIVQFDLLLDHLVQMAMQYHNMSGANKGISDIKNYYHSEHVRDGTSHDNRIFFMQHFDHLKSTVVLERDSPKIRIYDTGTLKMTHSLRGHKKGVLAVDYLPAQNLLMASSKDRTISFWSVPGFELQKTWNLRNRCRVFDT